MGEVVRSYDGPALSEAQFSGALKEFRGSYLQQVPRYAAVKIDGKRLYALTRKGIDVEPPSREVHIHHLELLDYQWPFATLEAHCSKGTYIRQLAADIGSRLQCGAHVSALRRLKSGKFGIEFATTLDNLCDTSSDNSGMEKLISMDEALPHLKGMVLTAPQVGKTGSKRDAGFRLGEGVSPEFHGYGRTGKAADAREGVGGAVVASCRRSAAASIACDWREPLSVSADIEDK